MSGDIRGDQRAIPVFMLREIFFRWSFQHIALIARATRSGVVLRKAKFELREGDWRIPRGHKAMESPLVVSPRATGIFSEEPAWRKGD